MKEFDQLTAAWKSQYTEPKGNSTEAITKSIVAQRKLRTKHLMQSILFFSTAIAIVVIDNITNEQIETSVTGFSILMGCSIVYGIIRLWLYFKLQSIDLTMPTRKLLDALRNYRSLAQFIFVKVEFIYAIILSVGVIIYLKPVFVFFSLEMLALIFSTYAGWVVFHTFVIKRREAKAESKQIEDLITALEK